MNPGNNLNSKCTTPETASWPLKFDAWKTTSFHACWKAWGTVTRFGEGPERIPERVFLSGGNSNIFSIFIPILGDMIRFHSYFLRWVGSTTNQFEISIHPPVPWEPLRPPAGVGGEISLGSSKGSRRLCISGLSLHDLGFSAFFWSLAKKALPLESRRATPLNTYPPWK